MLGTLFTQCRYSIFSRTANVRTRIHAHIWYGRRNSQLGLIVVWHFCGYNKSTTGTTAQLYQTLEELGRRLHWYIVDYGQTSEKAYPPAQNIVPVGWLCRCAVSCNAGVQWLPVPKMRDWTLFSPQALATPGCWTCCHIPKLVGSRLIIVDQPVWSDPRWIGEHSVYGSFSSDMNEWALQSNFYIYGKSIKALYVGIYMDSPIECTQHSARIYMNRKFSTKLKRTMETSGQQKIESVSASRHFGNWSSN